MTIRTYWLRSPFRRAGEPTRHNIADGSDYALCGAVSRLQLDTEHASALDADCPACAKAMEGGHAE